MPGGRYIQGVALGWLVALGTGAFGQPEGPGASEPGSGTGNPLPALPELPPATDESDLFGPSAGENDGSSVDLLFEDFDVVVTAARTGRSSATSAVPVSVLDADDIRYSGVKDLGELLGFVTGVDALQIGRNQFAIGVRGLHQTSSDRTLLLLNGRNASNPITGGFDLQRQPIFLPDIERVEVVRGPAGGSWGANAYNGVINIIEKSPRDTAGVLASSRFNERGDVKTNLRFGHAGGALAWRVSGEFEEVEALGDALSADPPGVVNGPSNDFARTRKFAFDGLYDATDLAELSFGASYAHVERGTFPTLSIQSLADDRIDHFRAHAQLAFDDDEGTSWYVQWYGTYQQVDQPAQWSYDAFDNAVEAQLIRELGDHELSGGVNVRLVNATTSRDSASQLLSDATIAEQWVGGFLADRWSIDDRWTLEAQGRVDWYSETEVDWAARVALLRALDPVGHHTLRLAAARSFRTPQAAIRDNEAQAQPLAPGLFAINFLEPTISDNETVTSAEIGYVGRLADGLTGRVDAYYHRYEDLTGAVLVPEPAPMVGRVFLMADSANSADAFGTDAELSFESHAFDLTGWYSYVDFRLNESVSGVRAYLPAAHKAGLRARYRPLDWWTLASNFSSTNGSEAPFVGQTVAAPEAYRLDLTTTFEPGATGLGLQLGVRDVFDEGDQGVRSVLSPSLVQPGLGRTFFAEVRIEF